MALGFNPKTMANAQNSKLPDIASPKTKLIIIAVLAVALLACIIYYTGFSKPDNNGIEPITIDGEPVETILLTDQTGDTVSGGAVSKSDGKAVRYTQDGKFFHEIVATLPELKEGYHYEGWLISDAENYISTGKLSLLGEPVYTLSFVSDEDYEDYLEVTVTLQPDSSKTPDSRILSGYFED